MQRVALLGLGTMGAGMAANWVAKGFALSVWNRTPAKAQALASKGAKAAATPREAATELVSRAMRNSINARGSGFEDFNSLSASASAVSPARQRAPGGSFIWPKTSAVRANTPDWPSSSNSSCPSRERSPMPANTEMPE